MGIEISNAGGGGITIEVDPLSLPKTGGLMTGAITFDSVGGQNINKGSFDSGRGGYNGISLNCAVGYELNWQAGYLKAKQIGGGDVPINIENSSIQFTGATFGDNIGISADANNGNSHTGFNLSTNNDSAGSILQISWGNYDEDYIHQTTLSQLGLNHYASELDMSTSYNLDGIHFADGSVQTTAGIPEAPIDGNYYVRKNGQWYQCTVHTQGGHNYLTI